MHSRSKRLPCKQSGLGDKQTPGTYDLLTAWLINRTRISALSMPYFLNLSTIYFNKDYQTGEEKATYLSMALAVEIREDDYLPAMKTHRV